MALCWSCICFIKHFECKRSQQTWWALPLWASTTSAPGLSPPGRFCSFIVVHCVLYDCCRSYSRVFFWATEDADVNGILLMRWVICAFCQLFSRNYLLILGDGASLKGNADFVPVNRAKMTTSEAHVSEADLKCVKIKISLLRIGVM